MVEEFQRSKQANPILRCAIRCMRHTAVLLVAGFAFAATPVSQAQPGAPSTVKPGGAGSYHFSIQVEITPPQNSNSFALSGVTGPLGARPVTGKPLTAEIVTQRHQVLNGGDVSRSTTSVLYRDGEGRIRRESQLSIPGLPANVDHFTYITIVDQQKGCGWYLDPQEKVARRYPLSGAGPSYMAQVNVRGSGELLPEPEAAVADASRSAAKASQSRLSAPTDSPARGGFEGQHGPLSAPAAPNVMRSVAAGMTQPAEARGRVHGGAGAPEMRINQPFLAAPHPVRIENLGEELILGVRAHGIRIVTTVPAGQIGNDHPIDIVSEQWYAPELELVMRSMHRDPWGGEIDTRVIKLTRGDQPESRFQVPDSYKIVDAAKDPQRRVLDVRSVHSPHTPAW